MEEESQPLIELSLGMGGSSLCCNTMSRSTSDHNWQKDKRFDRIVKVEQHDDHDGDQVVEREGCRKRSVVLFTAEQLDELKWQLVIFKCMVYGLPLPLHLLLPLRTTFALTSSPFCVFRGKVGKVDHRYFMDPEPDRCRRTDGKKWRCYQSVVPNEKYCEKHMHRGRKRSRKLVEASTITGPNEKHDNNPRFQVPAILHRNPQPINDPTKVVIRPSDLTNTGPKGNEKVESKNERKHNSIMKDRIAAISQVSGLDFSPKSVLQDGTRCPGVQSRMDIPEAVQQRCKRTDGKKWQCNNDVLPGKKYCTHHIHRNLKKPAMPVSASRETEVAHVSSSSAKTSGSDQAKIGMGLDTNLNISLATRLSDPRQSVEDIVAGYGGRSDSSTDATMSDDGIDVSDLIALSP